MSRYTKITVLAVILASAGSLAYAVKSAENDAVDISKAKIPMSQAVLAAEQHASGKAVRAEYEQGKQGWGYDVEVVAGAKVFDVRVDAEKGTVISSTEDKLDHDDDHDKKD